MSLTNQVELFQLPGVLHTGGYQIDSGCLDAGMSQHIRKPRNITTDLIEGTREQMPQIMRKNLRLSHARTLADGFHLRPYLPPGQSLTASGEKNLPGGDFVFLSVLEQLPAELSRQEDGTDFPLQRDLRPPRPGGFYGEILHL